MLTNIGLYNVENKLIPLLCAECGKILGASFQQISKRDDNIWFCYICLTDIGRVADTLEATNVFSARNVDDLFLPKLISEKPTSPLTVLMWCDEQREIIAEEKADNLLERSKRR